MSAHKNFFQTSDFILIIIIVVSLLLEWFIPTNLHINRVASITAGIFIVVLSWTIIIATKYQFKKANQKTGPNHETTGIIESGPLKYSRNPIYLGVLLLVPALGLVINSLWLLIVTIPCFLLIKYILIIPEEKYLLDKFGSAYSDYMKRVRRWF